MKKFSFFVTIFVVCSFFFAFSPDISASDLVDVDNGDYSENSSKIEAIEREIEKDIKHFETLRRQRVIIEKDTQEFLEKITRICSQEKAKEIKDHFLKMMHLSNGALIYLDEELLQLFLKEREIITAEDISEVHLTIDFIYQLQNILHEIQTKLDDPEDIADALSYLNSLIEQ